ncbi:hypothetical protein D9M68_626500 [compost metagenome]
MEGVLGGPAVRRGIGQRTHDFQQLEDGPWPAVGHDERHCVRMAGANVNEVDVQAVDIRQELG